MFKQYVFIIPHTLTLSLLMYTILFMYTLFIAGLYHLKVVRTRQQYQAIDEGWIGHPELAYDVLIDVPVKVSITCLLVVLTCPSVNDYLLLYSL